MADSNRLEILTQRYLHFADDVPELSQRADRIDLARLAVSFLKEIRFDFSDTQRLALKELEQKWDAADQTESRVEVKTLLDSHKELLDSSLKEIRAFMQRRGADTDLGILDELPAALTFAIFAQMANWE